MGVVFLHPSFCSSAIYPLATGIIACHLGDGLGATAAPLLGGMHRPQLEIVSLGPTTAPWAWLQSSTTADMGVWLPGSLGLV